MESRNSSSLFCPEGGGHKKCSLPDCKEHSSCQSAHDSAHYALLFYEHCPILPGDRSSIRLSGLTDVYLKGLL